MWGEIKGLMLVFWIALFVGGRVLRWKRWKGGEVTRFEIWEGRKVERWRKWESGEVKKVRGFWFYSRVGDAG